MQVEHPALPLGLAAAQAVLHRLDVRLGDAVEQAAGLCPGLLGGVPGDDVQPDAEAKLPPGLGGECPDPVQLVGDLGRRLPQVR
ncbi:hypothetical protein GCM10027614_05060 [Micromonospora vulcania]